MDATAIYSGKKSHFLFAEPWKGVGKGMLSPRCLLSPANLLLCELNVCHVYQLFLWQMGRRCVCWPIWSICLSCSALSFGLLHHGLRGSASPVLTATGFVNGRWQFSTPHRIHTPWRYCLTTHTNVWFTGFRAQPRTVMRPVRKVSSNCLSNGLSLHCEVLGRYSSFCIARLFLRITKASWPVGVLDAQLLWWGRQSCPEWPCPVLCL